MLIQKRKVLRPNVGGFIGQVVTGLGNQQHLRVIELGVQHFEVVLPINSFIRLALNQCL